MIESYSFFSEDKKIKKIVKCFNSGNLLKANNLLKSYIKKYPNNSTGHFLNSLNLFENKNNSESKVYVTSSIDILKKEIEQKELEIFSIKSDYNYLLFESAKFNWSAGFLNNVIKICDEILGKNDGFIDALVLKIKCLFESGNSDLAFDLLEKYSERFVEADEYKMLGLQYFFEFGRLEKCDEILKKCSAELFQDLRVQDIHLKTLMFYGKSKEIDSVLKNSQTEDFQMLEFAKKYYKILNNENDYELIKIRFNNFVKDEIKKINKNPPDNLSFFELNLLKANLNFHFGNPKLSIGNLNKILSINENHPLPYLFKSKIFFEYGNYADCINNLLIFNKITGGNSESKYLLASAYYYTDATEKAINMLEEVLTRNIYHYEAHYLKGLILEKEQKFSDALNSFIDSYKNCKLFLPAIKKIAELYYKFNDYRNAHNYLNIYIQYDNKDDAIHCLNGICQNRLKLFDEAINSYYAAIEISNKKGEYYHNLGLIQLNIGKFDDAIKNLKSASNLINNDSPVNLFNIGYAYFMKGMYKESIDYLTKALSINSNFFEAQYYLANCYFKLSDYSKSILLLQKAEELRKRDLNVILLLAKNYSKLDEYEKALNYYQILLGEYPDNFSVNLSMADFYFILENFAEAEKFFRKSLELDSENENANYKLALILESWNDFENALPYLEKLISRLPDSFEYRLKTGNIYIKLGLFEKALKIFQALEEENRTNIEVLNKLGLLYFNTKDFDKALEKFEMVYQLDENNLETLLMLGDIEVIQKEFSKAKRYYEKAMLIGSDNFEIYYKMAELSYVCEDYEEALDYSERGLLINFSNLKVNHIRAKTYRKIKNFEDAINTYKFLLQLDPNHFDALKELGEILYNSDDFADAIEYFEKALKINYDSELAEKIADLFLKFSDYQKALDFYLKLKENGSEMQKLDFNIGSIYYSLGELEKSLEFLNYQEEKTPDDFDIIVKKGDVYYLKNDVEKALVFYETAMKIRPSDENLFFKLGETYAKKNENEEAIKYFLKAIELNSHNFYYHFSLARFYKNIGDSENALQEYETTFELVPENHDVSKEYIDLMLESGKYKECLNLERKRVISDNLNPAIYYRIGFCLYKMEAYKDSATNLEYAIGLDTSYANAYYLVSKVYNLLGNFDKALQSSVKAMSINPNIASDFKFL